jgi:hypothetical protein
VHARPHLEADLSHRCLDRLSTAHGPSGSVERREEAVTGRVDLAAAMARQLLPRPGVMIGEQSLPPVVADLGARFVESTISVKSSVARIRPSLEGEVASPRNERIASWVRSMYSSWNSSSPGIRTTCAFGIREAT